jgi:Tol biopolymer transport system component
VRRGWLVGAGFVAGVGLFLTACGASKPRPDLAFVSTRDGDYAVFAMNEDGHRQVRLTSERGNASSPQALFFEIDPAWSPNGRLLAFASKRTGTFDIYVMNSDGSGSRQLTSTSVGDVHPTWSPDGSRIAFDRGTSGRMYVMKADGTGVRRITDDTADETDPAWSPRGNWIAYVRKTPGTDARELWLVRPDGSGRRQLTSLGAVSESPAWSPDGRRVAFSSTGGGLKYQIYSVDSDGKGIRKLTRSSVDAFEPAWSPDGTTIAFARGGSIVTIDAHGNEKKLTDPANNDSSPAWDPKPPGKRG